jgi:uncharacterized Ntn-hydrolase superfamily protein
MVKIRSKHSLLLACIAISLFVTAAKAQDTFSIVAIDSVTGEIGSAGASCVGSSGTYPHGAEIISDVIPGVGAIHTQAAWDPTNQQNAHNWMMMGLSPQQIIDSLAAHDVAGNPAVRQYGIADYNGGHPRSAAYTGINCLIYKNDTAHLNYSIQGNILAGQQIIDSIQARFLNTPGTLGDRLMAALQGAKVIGADARCTPHNTSSQSSFLRVAKMTDPYDTLYLDLWMAYPQNLTGIFPVDPIDSLQTLYNLWKQSEGIHDHGIVPPGIVKVYNGERGTTVFDFTLCKDWQSMQLSVFDMVGRSLLKQPVSSRILHVNTSRLVSNGILIYQVTRPDRSVIAKGKFFIQ